MKAGFAKANVNPPLGMTMEGLRQPQGCQEIHDDLFVRALYLTDGPNTELIVSFDLLFFFRPDIERFKKAIGRQTGLAPDHIFLNTSHTHAGPIVSTWNYSDGPDPKYIDQVEAALVDAVTRARASAVEVTLWAGQTHNQVPVSRRHINDKGLAEWRPSFSNIICDALPFCLFKDAAGKVVSLLFSISCHPSMIHDCIISAEFPGPAMKKLNQHFHTDGSMFLQGAAGDTKPRQIAVKEEHWRRGTFDEMDETGAEIAKAVIDKAGQGLTRIEPELRSTLIEMSWPLEPAPGREHYQSLHGDPNDSPFHQRWVTDMLQRIDRHETLPTAMPISIHALQLGKGLRLIGVEGEIVGELGNQILHIFNRGVTFPLGYTNGCQVYLTTDSMLPEHGYEVDSFWEYHWPSPLAPGGEKVFQDALHQLQTSGRIPNE